MRIYRFNDRGKARLALLDGENRVRLFDTDDIFEAADGGASQPYERTLDQLELLAPIRPGKVVAVGRNYADHARELGNEPPTEPILFLKPPSAVVGPEEPIRMPAISERVDFEGELAVVISRRSRRVSSNEWRAAVLGFTCANDVTARDLQKRDVQFTRAKSFDTFLPLGPCLQTDLDPASLSIRTRVSGEIRQDGTTGDMIFSVGELISYITSIMTLDPGDVILTGTPAGVGPLRAGDWVEVEIEGIGILRNPVRGEHD